MATLPVKQLEAKVLLKNGVTIKMKPIALKHLVNGAIEETVSMVNITETVKQKYISSLTAQLEKVSESFLEFHSEPTLSFKTPRGREVSIDTNEIAATSIKWSQFKTNLFNRV